MLSSSFGRAGAATGEFSEPRGVAVEEATGDVFVVDSGNRRVEKFNATGSRVLSEFTGAGTPPPEFSVAPVGIAVDNASSSASRGDVYVAVSDKESGEFAVDKFTPKGTTGNEPNEYEYQCQFTGPERGCLKDPETEGASGEKFEEGTGVAVDADGDVYIAAKDDVYEFEAEGASVAALHEFNFRTTGVAVTASDVYAITVSPETFTFELVKLEVNPATHVVEHESIISTEEVTAVTVDPNGNVYVLAEEGEAHVSRYDASGGLTGAFGRGQIGESYGIAFNAFDKQVDISDLGNSEVHIFEEIPGPPVTVTGGATDVAVTAARLNGTTNPEERETISLFEYGAAATPYEASIPAFVVGSEPPSVNDGAGGAPVAVTARLAGLEPNTAYHYQLVGTSILGSGSGGDQTFRTRPALATVNDQPPTASDVTRTAALLAGVVNPEHSATTFHFEYVDETGYNPLAVDPYSAGGRTASASAGEGFGDQRVSQQLIALVADTTYHYRLVANNQAGTVTGPDQTFTTGTSTPPSVSTAEVTDVTATAATISGSVDSQRLRTTYEVEFGSEPSYGATKLFGGAGESAGNETITVRLEGLAPNTTYHVRLEASNEDGETYGSYATFTTSGIGSPITQPLTMPLIAIPSTTRQVTSTSAKPGTTLTRAEKLARALRACASKRKPKRMTCERRARATYGVRKRK